MDLVEQVHIFGLSNINSFERNITLIGLFSLIFNYAKPRLIFFYDSKEFQKGVRDDTAL